MLTNFYNSDWQCSNDATVLTEKLLSRPALSSHFKKFGWSSIEYFSQILIFPIGWKNGMMHYIDFAA
jgi:hypothetical protein